jgi:hypothetical protein
MTLPTVEGRLAALEATLKVLMQTTLPASERGVEAALNAVVETLTTGQRRVAKLEADALAMGTLLDTVVKVFLPNLADLIARPRALAKAIVAALRARGFNAEADEIEAAYGREMADAALAETVRTLTEKWERARRGEAPPDVTGGA